MFRLVNSHESKMTNYLCSLSLSSQPRRRPQKSWCLDGKNNSGTILDEIFYLVFHICKGGKMCKTGGKINIRQNQAGAIISSAGVYLLWWDFCSISIDKVFLTKFKNSERFPNCTKSLKEQSRQTTDTRSFSCFQMSAQVCFFFPLFFWIYEAE